MDEIAKFAGNNFYNESRSEKAPLVFNMLAVNSTSVYVDIEATFTMEAGLPIETVDAYPYTESWHYGQFGNDVTNECNNSEDLNFDAPDLFRRDLRNNISYRNNGHYYLRDPYSVCFNAASDNCAIMREIVPAFPIIETIYDNDLVNPNDNTASDNLYDFLLFRNRNLFSNFDVCLAANEMNFYYESMEDLALSKVPSSAYVIGNIEVGYKNITFFTSILIWHAMQVTIMKKVTITSSNDYEALALPCCN